MNDKIFLEEVSLFGYIGVFEEEKRKGQTFLVDLCVWADLFTAGKSDDLSATISYAELFDMAKELMDTAKFDLVETYAEQLAASILERYSLAQKVGITIKKPDAPIEGSFKSAGISIERSRSA